MQKKNEAQKFLEQVEKADTIIANKLVEKRQWHDLALSITANMSGERVQSSGTKDKMASALDRCVDMEGEIDKTVAYLAGVKKKVTQTIERLHSPTEYDVLHKRYIQYWSLQDIADHYGKDYGWATTTHGRALKNVQILLERRDHHAEDT